MGSRLNREREERGKTNGLEGKKLMERKDWQFQSD